MPLTLGASLLQNYEAASEREWLVTNGIGGYASGSLSGANTRRYHGLLVAALTPPTGRRVALSRLEEKLDIGAQSFELSANEYPGALHPQGFRYLERFDACPAPTFTYAPQPGLRLRKEVWMARNASTTYVRYTLDEAPEPVRLRLTPLVCWKDYHSEMRAGDGFPLSVNARAGETAITLTEGAPALRLLLEGAEWERAGYWHYHIEHSRERERGLDWQEDLYCPGHFRVTLAPGRSVTLTATLESKPQASGAAWKSHVARQENLLKLGDAQDDFERALTLAADAFLIEGANSDSGARARKQGNRAARSTLIAGYPWFADWGRDTMIALPGLCLSTGRHEIARDILLSFAEAVSEGMLPNRFPDEGETPEYNTADATLWYFQAIQEYAQAANDGEALIRRLWPVLTDILAWHARGTRYGIHVDPADGLLAAGVPGVQLTWMDAKVGDWVVTPRIGKPVEINALWYNALVVMADFAARLGEDGEAYARRARQVKGRFRAGFVRPDGRGLYDLLTEVGPDASVRPNQIFAASLPHSPLTRAERRAVVDAVQRELLTPFGLRTLSPCDSAYRPAYGGSVWERDGAYHQGTVWPWLLGPFALAHHAAYGNAETARSFLRPLEAHLRDAGIGSISEILDGDAPHHPNGCIAQAWSVGETLRAWKLLRRA